jgi:hypothetical protein
MQPQGDEDDGLVVLYLWNGLVLLDRGARIRLVTVFRFPLWSRDNFRFFISFCLVAYEKHGKNLEGWKEGQGRHTEEQRGRCEE